MEPLSSQTWRKNIRHILGVVKQISAHTNRKEILQAASGMMVNLLDVEAAVVSAWDAPNQMVVPKAYHISADWDLPSVWYDPKPVADHPLFQRVQSLGRSAQFNLDGMSLPKKILKRMEEAGIKSWVAFPLIAPDHSIIGVVDILERRESRSFSDDEMALGDLLANLSSLVYESAQLHDRNEIKNRQLDSIMDLITLISPRDVDEGITENLVNLARIFGESSGADGCVFSKYDDVSGQLTPISVYTNHNASIRADWCRPGNVAARPVVLDTLKSKKPSQIKIDGFLEPNGVNDFLASHNIGSLLVLPLAANNQVIGLVEVANEDPNRSYLDDEIEILTNFVQHIGRAISFSESSKKQKRDRRFAEALVNAARAMNSSLNINEVLERILEQIVVVMNCKSANIMLVEKDYARMVKHVGYEDHSELLQNLNYSLTTNNLRSMFEQRKSVIIQNTENNPDWITYKGAEWIKSYIGAPLIFGEEVIGFLNMDHNETDFFSKDMVPKLEAFASIAASVLRNAQQYKSVKDRASELEIVRQATLSLTSSLDLEEVLSAILRQSLDLFTGPCDGHIFLYSNNLLRFGAAMRGDGTQGHIWSEPRQDGLTYTVARTGMPIIVDDMRKHPLFRNTPEDWVGSIIGLPLQYGGSVVGVMNIAHQETYKFTDQQIRVLSLLADQAAISIVNARLHNIVQAQSLTDPLTGLYNRRAFNKRLEEETLRSKRYGRQFSLALMDLNGFKNVNDTFGHPSGDKVLIRIGQCLSDNVRNTDFLARYGGDEFALIMPETSKKIAVQMTNRLQRVLKSCRLGLPENPMLPISVSIGIAQYPENAMSEDILIAVADDALYKAKRSWNQKNR